jgi:hypothetical protein
MELFVSTTATAPLSFAPFRRGGSPSVVAPLRRRFRARGICSLSLAPLYDPLPHSAVLSRFVVPASGWRTASAAVPDPVPSEEPAASSFSTVVVTDKPCSAADEKGAGESSASSASVTDKPDSPADEKVADESSVSSASVDATVAAPASVEDGGLDDILSKVSPCCTLHLHSCCSTVPTS